MTYIHTPPERPEPLVPAEIDLRGDGGFILDLGRIAASEFVARSSGVEELRIRDESGAFRVIYTARFPKAVYALHAFQKKSRKTAQADIDLAKARYQTLLKDREK